MYHRERFYGLSDNPSDTSRKLLRVRILSASDLVRKDIFGLSDPYVKIILQNVGRRGAIIDFAKTRVIPRTLNPLWNEEFCFRVIPEKHRILFELYDNNRLMKDDFLGQIVVKLNTDIVTELPGQSIDNDLDAYVRHGKLQKKAVFNRVKGEMTFSLSFHHPDNPLPLLSSTRQALRLSSTAPSVASTGRSTGPANEENRVSESSNRGNEDIAAISAASSDPLPPGWEMRRDSSGREYYVDHNSRRTSWNRPTRESSNGNSDIPLPPGWQISYTTRGRMFFINHADRKTTWIDPRTGQPSPMQNRRPSSTVGEGSGTLPPGWEMRIHSGRTLFIDHNRKRTQWEDPRLEQYAGPSVPFSPRFEEKLKFFKRQLPKPKSYVGSQIELHVSRTSILETSFRAVMPFRDPEYLKARLWVIFDGEKGLDYGGVAREWFHLLAKELFNPGYGLFTYSAIDNYTLQVNPLSGLVNEEHLRYFMFVGRVVGMAIYHNKLLDAFFVPPFYKMMLERPVSLSDLESIDRDYYNSLKYILDNDPEGLDLYFSVTEDVFGETQEHDLIPNGREVPVTQTNKRDFINKMMEWRLSGRIKSQMDHFMFGFNEMIPKDDVKLFDPKELELLISGIGEINVRMSSQFLFFLKSFQSLKIIYFLFIGFMVSC